ncbi:hypothetical protein [Singulisphaera acidiphila]|uniref:Uncharacterized protein n=1 Tax=Singulisphaera acidiphila (strain ATCC BAA-1392 / DSM 18658 / VKM B-2454 / MOB10) TaxID=886293 RepID=L0DAN5_SINAD|nr:hypothetical protein [Singulisphaera acidiphila]AGA25883.1 hypothetical protein Sinac_1503 [Singulisphaera acidiphila DSM 18658]
MQDFAFYNAGSHDLKGPRGLLVMVRRLMRRVLRPIFLRQVEIFQYLADRLDNHENRVFALRIDADAMKRQHQALAQELGQQNEALAHRQDLLSGRQDELADQIQTTMAFGWDYVAMVRRLATLEDQLALLTGSTANSSDDGDAHPSILFPGLEKGMRKPAQDDDEQGIRSKVC